MKKYAPVLPTAAVFALFILSGRVMTVGRQEGFSIVDAAAGGVAAAVILPVAVVAARSVFGRGGIGARRSLLGKCMYAFVSVPAICATLLTAWGEADRFSRFASEVMFLRISPIAVAVIFLFLCVYAARCGIDTLKKLSVVFGIFVTVAAAVLLLLSLPNLEMKHAETALRELSFSARGAALAFCRIFAPAVVAAVGLSLSERAPRAVSAAVGCGWAAVILALCCGNVLFMFGAPYAAALEYPYADAVGTVTAGKLFARMEGVAYMVAFAASAVKLSVCAAVVLKLLRKLRGT